MKPLRGQPVITVSECWDRMWIATKAAAARHGTSAWSPNPPTLLPWYPQQLFLYVQCQLLCLLHTLATGYPRPNRRGRQPGTGTRKKKGMRARTATVLVSPQTRTFSDLALDVPLPRDAKKIWTLWILLGPGTQVCGHARALHRASTLNDLASPLLRLGRVRAVSSQVRAQRVGQLRAKGPKFAMSSRV